MRLIDSQRSTASARARERWPSEALSQGAEMISGTRVPAPHRRTVSSGRRTRVDSKVEEHLSLRGPIWDPEQKKRGCRSGGDGRTGELSV